LTIREGPVPAPQGRVASTLRDLAPSLVPLVLLIVGLAIAIASLESHIETAYSASFSGLLGTGNQTFPIGPWSAQYLQVNLPIGACSLRVYLATSAESVQFNSTGERPSRWVSCTSRSITATGEVLDLIVVNDGAQSEGYNVTVEAYSIRTPNGWLAIPGTFLALAGLVIFVPRLVLQQGLKMRDELDPWRKK
jgi:hypothetical protein